MFYFRKNCLVTHISNARETIIVKLKNINNIQNKWKNSALKISKELEKENEKNKKLKIKCNSIISGNKSRFSEISSLDRAPKLENHSNFIKILNALHDKFINNDEFKNNIDYINDKETKDIIENLEFKNNIDYINDKETKDIIENLNSKIIFNKSDDDNKLINDTEISKDKKELETLINELKEKNNKNRELFVLHELVSNIEQRVKEDNSNFIERNYKKLNDEKIFESRTKKFGVILDEQIEKLKKMELNLNKLMKELDVI